MSLDEHAGYVEIGGERWGATLKTERDHLRLEVVDAKGTLAPGLPERIDLLQFRGSRSYFSLIRLFRINSEARLGVGG